MAWAGNFPAAWLCPHGLGEDEEFDSIAPCAEKRTLSDLMRSALSPPLYNAWHFTETSSLSRLGKLDGTGRRWTSVKYHTALVLERPFETLRWSIESRGFRKPQTPPHVPPPWARGKSHLVTPILQVLYSALGAPAIAVAVASLLSKHSTRATICVVRNTVVVSSQPPARFIRTAATDAPVEARVGGTTVMNPQWTLWAEAVSISVSLRRLGRHDGRMTYYGSTETRSRAVGRCGQSTRSICALANWLLAAATAIYLIPRQLLRDGYLRMQRNQEKFQIWRVGPW
ncbi:hypothetical protein QBC37DRAFT_399219 [Rhypophila decipiens]|uniref:Uncharacterized protein n=1 Tax=Rhypophila decipiens TaxID=261697 RepID=A0AAN6YA55_9PEZI|nr:hypothetical protein QBC37DRAFT_399219 [Rhypophila decipiens]